MKMELIVQDRTWLKAYQLLKQWLVPAIVYGKHLKDPIVISCIKNDFLKRYKEAGYSMPITLKWKDVDQMVLIQDIQLDPVTDSLLHIDFLAVNKNEKVRTEVPVVLTGESLIEKLGEGKIQLIKDFIEVEAFPQDLPHNFSIDISAIKTMNDTVFVKDIKVSDKVMILDDMDQVLVTVLKLEEEAAATTTATPEAWATATPAAWAAPAAAKPGDKKPEAKKPEGKDKK